MEIQQQWARRSIKAHQDIGILQEHSHQCKHIQVLRENLKRRAYWDLLNAPESTHLLQWHILILPLQYKPVKSGLAWDQLGFHTRGATVTGCAPVVSFCCKGLY